MKKIVAIVVLLLVVVGAFADISHETLRTPYLPPFFEWVRVLLTVVFEVDIDQSGITRASLVMTEDGGRIEILIRAWPTELGQQYYRDQKAHVQRLMPAVVKRWQEEGYDVSMNDVDYDFDYFDIDLSIFD